MNIYIYLISSWVKSSSALELRFQLWSPAAQRPPLNGQMASEKKPIVAIFSYDPLLDLCLVKSL